MEKQYEIADHLGDLLDTVSDKRSNDSLAGSHTAGAIDTIKSYKPIVVSATDYYPFGMQMPGRSRADTGSYCFVTSIPELLPHFTHGSYAMSHYTTTPYGGASLSTGGTDLRVTSVGTGSGVAINIDSLIPYLAQTIYLTIDTVFGSFEASIIVWYCRAHLVGHRPWYDRLSTCNDVYTRCRYCHNYYRRYLFVLFSPVILEHAFSAPVR